MIYLDNAATTKIDDSVLEEMMPYLTELYGNPGGRYPLGYEAKRAVDKARERVAAFLHCTPEHIIFTSGGTESNNFVFRGLSGWLCGKSQSVAISSIEHDSVIKASSVGGLGLNRIHVRPDSDGIISLGSLGDAVSMFHATSGYLRNIGLVSVMHTNNETGLKNEVERIGDYCSRRGILFHTDCVQAAGCCDLNVDTLNCDFLSLSSHKIHGPKGVGALYVRDFKKLSPMIYGGHMQEFGFRGGTENVPGIVGFGKACEIARKTSPSVSALTLWRILNDEFLSRGLDGIMSINGNPKNLLGKTINISFKGIDAETLMMISDDICVSTGSACRSREVEPSRVLREIGIPDALIRSSLRFSVSKYTTEEEVAEAAKIIAKNVEFLLSTSNGE